MGTHYDTMGLTPSATHDEIERQYRALAKIVHPDLGGDAVMFTVLDEAYDVLADPRRRAAYDRSLAQPAAVTAPREPTGPSGRREGRRVQPAFYPDGTPRLSTPQQRAEARRRATWGQASWHLTPREYVRAGLRGLGFRLALVVGGLVIFGIVALIRG